MLAEQHDLAGAHQLDFGGAHEHGHAVGIGKHHRDGAYAVAQLLPLPLAVTVAEFFGQPGSDTDTGSDEPSGYGLTCCTLAAPPDREPLAVTDGLAVRPLTQQGGANQPGRGAGVPADASHVLSTIPLGTLIPDTQ